MKPKIRNSFSQPEMTDKRCRVKIPCLILLLLCLKITVGSTGTKNETSFIEYNNGCWIETVHLQNGEVEYYILTPQKLPGATEEPSNIMRRDLQHPRKTVEYVSDCWVEKVHHENGDIDYYLLKATTLPPPLDEAGVDSSTIKVVEKIKVGNISAGDLMKAMDTDFKNDIIKPRYIFLATIILLVPVLILVKMKMRRRRVPHVYVQYSGNQTG